MKCGLQLFLLCIVAHSSIVCSLSVSVSNNNSEHDRVRRQEPVCQDFEFKCDDGTCINQYETCDGIENCPDGSDETGRACRELICPRFAFRCTYGACITGSFECNGVKDCADNSDELTLNCPGVIESLQTKGNCSDGYFQCTSGLCIHDDQVCNGNVDCPDRSDEQVSVCATNYCPPYAFKCSYGACVSGSARCNGVEDCADGSDEKLKACGNVRPTTTTTTRRPVIPVIQPEGSCVVPYIENGRVRNVRNEVLHAGQFAANGESIYYQCISSRLDRGNSSTCIEGEFIDGIRKCLKQCSTLVLDSLSVKGECFNKNFKAIACTETVAPGTVARLSCKTGYKLPNRHIVDSMSCLEDGEWSDHVFKCDPVCGEITEGYKYIVGGKKTNITQVPWHAAIYQKTSNGTFLQICGGTIIGPSAILTAAHCFWNGNKKALNSPTLFGAAVGKTLRNYYETEAGEQHFDAVDIKILEQYNDYDALYQGDIAVLLLNRPIIYTPIAKPICLNFNLRGNEKYIVSDLLGRVAGWGLDEENKSSPFLKVLDIPTVDYNKCKLNSKPSFVPFIGVDKFCAGTALTENVCQGDSGGGLVIPIGKDGVTKYYLRGLVSVGGAAGTECAVNHYTTFTNVLQYEEFFFFYTQH